MKKVKTNKLGRRILSIVLTAALVVGLMPNNVLTVRAATTAHDISTGSLEISSNGDYTITGSTTSNTVTVKSGVTANLTPTITWNDQTLASTGEEADITAPTITFAGTDKPEVEHTYSYKVQGDAEYTAGLPSDCGIYDVKVNVSATDNYNAVEDTMTLTITCTDADNNGICDHCGSYDEPERVDEYYQIANAGNLMWFAQKVNEGQTTINAKLTADIDMKDIDWTIMNSFAGTFDGDGHTILYLCADESGGDDDIANGSRCGLFQTLSEGGTVTNLTISGAQLWSAQSAGAIVAVNNGTISKCIVKDTTIELGASHGLSAIAGTNTGTVTDCGVVNCFLQRRWGAADNSDYAIGVIVEDNSGTVSNCFSYGCTFNNSPNLYAIVESGNAPVNCYYYTDATVSDTVATSKTAEAFASGEVAYLLNGSSSENVTWYQKLLTDTYPVLDSKHGIVYYGYVDCQSQDKIYANTELSKDKPEHEESDILYTGEGEKAPTCTVDGIGHTECTKCKEPMQTNVTVEASGHTGGTATCKNKAECSVCHEGYGELDKNNHAGETEVKDAKKATCAVDGYTGDTYCKDCGAKIATGTKIDKSTAHTWDNGVVTKEATATEKGEKTYTCSVCKTTKKEEIPALGAPKVGEEIVSEDGSATYKVTEAGENGNSVTYEAPTDKNKATVVVPATVTINNITYNVTTISDTAFAGNKKLTSVTIGDNVTGFSDKTFKGCSNLKTVDVGNGVTSIPANAFKNFKNLTTVKMGTGVKTIGKNAFYGCKKLKNLTIGKNVVTIGDKAFYKCTSLTKVTIPSKVKTIGKSTFEGCKALKTITVGKSVTKIGSKAFYGCSKTKTLTIKSSKLTTKKIGSKAFTKTPKSMTVKVPKKKFKAYKSMFIKRGVNKKAKFRKS